MVLIESVTKTIQNLDPEVKIWYAFLVVVTVFNILWYFSSLSRNTAKFPKAYTSYRGWMKVLAGIYLLGCGTRALLPRVDVERICMYDIWISWPLFGRVLATAAELSFMAQLSMTLHFIASELPNNLPLNKIVNAKNPPFLSFIKGFTKLCFAINVVAQTLCWMGITTTKQVWHCFEESIWAFSLFGMTISAWYMYNYINTNNIKNKTHSSFDVDKVKRYLQLFMVCGSVYVAYMLTVDIPMYYNRWLLDEANHRVYNTVLEGIKDAGQCKLVTGKYADWVGDFSWMVGYFSVAVWGSIFVINGLSPL